MRRREGKGENIDFDGKSLFKKIRSRFCILLILTRQVCAIFKISHDTWLSLSLRKKFRDIYLYLDGLSYGASKLPRIEAKLQSGAWISK